MAFTLNTLSRRDFIKTSGLGLAGLQLSMNQCGKPAQQRPNIVLLMADDFGYGDLSFHGNTQIRTPNIDSIAHEGIRLTQFYQSPAACAPTRASLLTGRNFLRTGVWGVHWGRDFLSLDETTMADALKQAGYATGAFGKWHSGKTNAYFSWNRGFDTGVHSRLYQYFDTRVVENNREIYVKGPITETITDRALQFIEDNQNRPFFCYVPFQAIHEPFNAPDKAFQKYKSRGHSDHVARCYGMIDVLDENIGRILDRLKTLNLTENTLVMFMVDDGHSPGCDLSYSNRRMNAEEQAERERAWPKKLRGSKANIWQGGELSPCFMRWPGQIPAGKDIAGHAGVIDIFPTILDYCRVPMVENQLFFDGQSLKPLIEGRAEGWQERVYFNATNFYQIEADTIGLPEPRIRWMSAHYQNYKLVRIDHHLIDGSDRVENQLFDLADDPAETRNVAALNPDVVQKLKKDMADWYQGILDSNRAFKTVTYQIGDWNEPASPINLDGLIDKTGPLERPGPGFYFTRWTENGSRLSYDVNILEAGLYEVEVLLRANPGQYGALFEAATEHDAVSAVLQQEDRMRFPALKLPAGRQTLTFTLRDKGTAQEAVDWVDLMIVHRIPETKDRAILRNPRFFCRVPGQTGEPAVHFQYAVTASFMNERVTSPRSLETFSEGDSIEMIPRVDNGEFVDCIDVYLDFDRIVSLKTIQSIRLKDIEPGRHTLNVVFVNVEGIKSVCCTDIQIEADG